MSQDHTWHDQQVPVYGLGDLLSYRFLRPELPLSQVLAAVPSPADWEAPMLILSRGDSPLGPAPIIASSLSRSIAW